jgi:hypothetical protein
MLRNRLTQTVTVNVATLGSTDRYGNPTTSATSSTDYDAWIEPLSSMENVIDRDTRVSMWRVILPEDATISAVDTVTYDNQTFRVRGAPRTVVDALGDHHIEADLELVEG